MSDVLIANEAAGNGGKQLLALATEHDAVTFTLGGRYDWVVFQLSTETAWTGGAILTVEISIDGVLWFDFPSVAITYSSTGVKLGITIIGVVLVRVRVSTAAAGSDTIRVFAAAGRDV